MAKLIGVFWQHLVSNISELNRSVFFQNFSLPLFTVIFIFTCVTVSVFIHID